MAYIVATSFYQIARFGEHPVFSSLWLLAMAILTGGSLFTLRMARPVRRQNNQEATAMDF